MSGTTAAKIKKIEVSLDGITWEELPGSSASMTLGADVLDDTNFETNAGYRTKCIGLKDWSVTTEAFWNSTNPGLALLQTALLADTDTVQVRYMPTGVSTLGLKGPVLIEGYNPSGEVASLEAVSVSLQGNGALVELT